MKGRQPAPKTMNNSNPLIPQGSNLEQKIKGRSRVKLAVLCVFAAHVLFLGPLLIQGCKREQPSATVVETNALPPLDSLTNELTQLTNNLIPPPVETPPPVPPPAETPAPSTIEHTVLKGESFSTIGKKFGVSVKAIGDANPGVDSARLKIGQRLIIPPSIPKAPDSTGTVPMAEGETLYEVKSGDSLSKIAKDHGTTVKAIQSANNLSTTRILVGQKLKIPAPRGAAPTFPPATVPPAN
jgi:LysM repeat protein